MFAVPVERGCGTRQGGGCYVETGLSDHGLPLETFLVDPPLTEGQIGSPEWFRPHRVPLWLEHGGAWHLVIWVGAEHYENVWDFIEETRVAGISRRVPGTLQFERLTLASRLIFVHPEAAVAHAALQGRPTQCPARTSVVGSASDDRWQMERHGRRHPAWPPEGHCLGAAKYLVAGDEGGQRTIACGHRYVVRTVDDPAHEAVPLQARPAVFLQTPLTGISMVTDADGRFDPEKQARVTKASVPTQLTDR